MAGKNAGWALCEEFADFATPPGEAEPLRAARERAAEIGAASPTPGTGAALRLLARAINARAVVEVGTGAGVASLYLLSGMSADGVLTTIDREVENQRAARESFRDAGIAGSRTRTITGRETEVLRRLTDAAYDMVVFPAGTERAAEVLEQARRVLRAGGLLALTNALGGDRVADPAARDEETTRIRALVRELREDESFLPALLPVGDGLLVASRA
ncbi:O-methyltransferase [Dermabacteraceae bacterium P7006]